MSDSATDENAMHRMAYQERDLDLQMVERQPGDLSLNFSLEICNCTVKLIITM